MDIQKENTKYLAYLLANCGATQDEINDLSFDDEVGFFESNRLADWFVSQINFGWRVWQAAKAQAAPRWISVKNAMPKAGSQVLTYDDYGFVSVENIDGWEDPNNVYFSHWLPLPPVEQEPAND